MLLFNALKSLPTELVAHHSDVVLLFDGNSLTEGLNNAGINQYYPKEVDANFNGVFKSKEFYSYGVSGQSTRQMLADVQTQIYPKAITGKQNILIAWEDANSILQIESGYDNSDKVTAQENYDDFITYFNGAKSAGFQHCIILTGYYPRKSTNGNYELGSYIITPESVDEQEVFFNLVSNADTNNVPWDHHIDLRNAPNIGGVKGQFKDITYFKDYIHLNALGYDEIATMVTNKINEIFNL